MQQAVPQTPWRLRDYDPSPMVVMPWRHPLGQPALPCALNPSPPPQQPQQQLQDGVAASDDDDDGNTGGCAHCPAPVIAPLPLQPFCLLQGSRELPVICNRAPVGPRIRI